MYERDSRDSKHVFALHLIQQKEIYIYYTYILYEAWYIIICPVIIQMNQDFVWKN